MSLPLLLEQIREGMRMMGFSDWALFSSWYLVYMALFGAVAVLIAIICKLSMFPNSSPIIVRCVRPDHGAPVVC